MYSQVLQKSKLQVGFFLKTFLVIIVITRESTSGGKLAVL